MSAKLERALHLKDKCEHELEQFCESKNRRRLHHAPASPTSCGALEGTLWLEAEKANDASARGASLYVAETTNRVELLRPAMLTCSYDMLVRYCCDPEKLALERLVRRIAPSLSNGVSSHADLLHMLHSCRECNMRVAFCSVCAERASEFFSGYTTTELLALYGRDLPPADADALAAFSNAIAARVASSTRITGDT